MPYRVALHIATGALGGGVSGALGAGASASSAELMNGLQDGLTKALMDAGMSLGAAQILAQGVSTLTMAGVGAALGGAQGAATAATVDANNRQLHATERQRATELAAKGVYSKEKIEEQMRLMGNLTFGVAPNTSETLTNVEAIGNNLQQDPGMPKAIDGRVVVEVPGQANLEIQRYIIANTKDGAGYVPGASPYSISNIALNSPTVTDGRPAVMPTAACGNMDLACRSGVGVQQSTPLTSRQQQAVGEYFGQMSTDYQRAAALATVTGNAPVVLSFEIAAGVTGLLEQAFNPSVGKVLVDSSIDVAAVAYSKASGIPIAIINEVVERIIKPAADPWKIKIDQTATGAK